VSASKVKGTYLDLGKIKQQRTGESYLIGTS